MTPIPINLAVEDKLSEAVVRKILIDSKRSFAVGTCYGHGGFGYLKKNIMAFNNAARITPFFILTDLDKAECAPDLIDEWISFPRYSNLIFRIAVKEVEAWVMAHSSAFAEFLGINKANMPLNPDELNDPKKELIKLAKKSRKSEIREAIVPLDSTTRIGPDYNNRLISFIQTRWKTLEAAKQSPSLHKAFKAIKSFQYIIR